MSTIKELLVPRKPKGREFTVSVDQETYDLVGKVAVETGRSRPEVVGAFVKSAYETCYLPMRRKSGL